jgi:2-oxoisovalerate dehydrogenase E1 component alpha subunit
MLNLSFSFPFHSQVVKIEIRLRMMRRCTVFRCSLDAAISKIEHVWNMKFSGKPTTNALNFHTDPKPATPMFSVLTLEGNVHEGAADPGIPRDICRKMISTMISHHTTDTILLEAQRQGRISFYMTSFGEEAAVVGSAAALQLQDEVFLQYREAALLAYRGFGVDKMIAQCMGNIEDPLKGRQMPIHYGSKELNVQMVSSPLATQIPQAAGAGYAFKLEKGNRICACYFGEGAASEGDFHAGLNFASTVGSRSLFFVRNNGFAISTPASAQYRGEGILPRGIAYGIPSIRVDGNDALAVFTATRRARELILEHNTPVLIEAMSYRVSHHSTSDDSTAYRPKSEIKHFDDTFSPIRRFSKYLINKGWWSDEETNELRKSTEDFVVKELSRQEKVQLYPVDTLFEDTFATMTPGLRQQKEETIAHYNRNKEFYDSDNH